jgi:hypothetical protein
MSSNYRHISDGMFNLTPAEFFAMGIGSRKKILEWKGEKLIGPLIAESKGYTLFLIYQFLIELIDNQKENSQNMQLLDKLGGLNRYLKSIRIELDQNRLIIHRENGAEPTSIQAPPE